MRTDLLLRGAAPAGAIGALVAGAPTALCGGLALTALGLGVERLTQRRATPLADRVVTGLGGVIVAVILSGIVLGSTSIGLSTTTWVVALAVLSVGALVVAGLLPRRDGQEAESADRSRIRTGLLLLPWLAAGIVVVMVSVNMSASSLLATDQPPLQLSLGRVSGTEVEVVVSATDAIGPLELRTTSDINDVSYPTFSIAADQSVATTVSIPLQGRWTITVNYPDQTTPLRTLTLDR